MFRHIPEKSIYLILFLISFSVSTIAVLYFQHQPQIYDEFAYLIGADLLTKGMLCAAKHPLWQHFETFMMISTPAYCSKYFPFQSAILAIGQIVFNNPLLGASLIYALTTSISFWMFRGLFSYQYSLIGALIVCFHPTVNNNIALNQMGSIGAFLASFIIFGSYLRLRTKLNAKSSAIFGLGCGLLLLSRPWEGFIISFILGSAIIVHHRHAVNYMKELILPAAFVLSLFVGVFLTYNNLTTGQALKSPYLIYEKTYGFMRPFIFSPPPPPIQFRHYPIQKLHEARNSYYRVVLGSFKEFIKFEWGKFDKIYTHFWSTIGCLMFGFIFFLRRDKDFWEIFGIIVAFYLLAIFPVFANHAHYSNPAAAGFFLIMLFLLKAGLSHQRWLRFACLIILLGTFYQSGQSAYLKIRNEPNHITNTWKRLERKTAAKPGQHLIVVDFGGKFPYQQDFVYNYAPIDEQPIVYARSLGQEQNQKLFAYYKNRNHWEYKCAEGHCNLNPINTQNETNSKAALP